MGSSYANYDLPRTVEDPEQECIEWFWVGLNDDDVYPKEFLEGLMQMVDDIEMGKIETIPMEDVMKELQDLVEIMDTLETGPEDLTWPLSCSIITR